MRGRIFIDFATILSCIARRKNYLLSSHVWRQDHNGFSHQYPGFLDHVINKKAEVVRVYLPLDANSLLSVTNHCSGLIHRLTYRRTNHHNFMSMTFGEKAPQQRLSIWMYLIIWIGFTYLKPFSVTCHYSLIDVSG